MDGPWHRRRQRGSGGSGFEPGGQQGKEFGVEFYRPSWNLQERGGSKQLHWLGSWIFFFLVAQNSCWSSSSWSVRYRDGRSGGILRREAAKTTPGREGGAGAGLGLLSSGEAQADSSGDPREGRESRTGLGFPAAGSHSGNVGGPRVVTSISTDESRVGRALRVPRSRGPRGRWVRVPPVTRGRRLGRCREGAAPSVPRSLGCF